jgi:uncharacterized protein
MRSAIRLASSNSQSAKTLKSNQVTLLTETQAPLPQSSSSPDYSGLVTYLVKPFLESPDSLKVACEYSPRNSRILVRLAFEGEDKGRVFGRGGRNIQAIRTVLQTIAQTAGQTAHLEVFGGAPERDDDHRRDDRRDDRRSSPPPRASAPRSTPLPKPKPRQSES